MKIHDISVPNLYGICPILLSKDIHNDIILDNCFIKIKLTPDHPRDFMYRRLWETVFLRRNRNDWSEIDDNGVVTLNISFVEAINFIKAVTPPIYQPRVNELYSTTDDIKESLELFLKDNEESVINQNISIFKKGMGFQTFETQSKYDVNRTKILRDKSKSIIVLDVEACTCPISDIYKGDVRFDSVSLQGMISLFNKSQFIELFKLLVNEMNYMYILNVFENNMNGTFIEFYVKSSIDFSEKFSGITKLIQNSYKNIINIMK